MNECLQYNITNAVTSKKNTLFSPKKSLNHKWQIFKNSILQAAKVSLKTKKQVSAKNETLEKLVAMRSHLTNLNKIFAFTTSLVYFKAHKNHLIISFAQLQHIWSRSANRLSLRQTCIDIIHEFLFNIN